VRDKVLEILVGTMVVNLKIKSASKGLRTFTRM